MHVRGREGGRKTETEREREREVYMYDDTTALWSNLVVVFCIE